MNTRMQENTHKSSMLPVVDLWDAKEKECHENVEEVKYCEEDHQVMERLLGALSREDEDAEKVAKQTHRTDGDHEDPLDEELEHVEVALLLRLVLARHLALSIVRLDQDETSL